MDPRGEIACPALSHLRPAALLPPPADQLRLAAPTPELVTRPLLLRPRYRPHPRMQVAVRLVVLVIVAVCAMILTKLSGISNQEANMLSWKQSRMRSGLGSLAGPDPSATCGTMLSGGSPDPHHPLRRSLGTSGSSCSS